MVCLLKVLGPLLVILLQGSMKLRLAAARLCERLLPQAPLEMVQVLALFTLLPSGIRIALTYSSAKRLVSYPANDQPYYLISMQQATSGVFLHRCSLEMK